MQICGSSQIDVSLEKECTEVWLRILRVKTMGNQQERLICIQNIEWEKKV